jgi:tRNA dimethylallyltransferase
MNSDSSTPYLARDAWFLTGPTASGKSGVGLELAQRLRAEIISLDSMAIYRGMDVGTAKPTAEARGRVPHHLLDIVEPSEEFSLSQYVTAAEEVVRDIRGRGREVLFVGGTPLYLKALLRGMFEGPPADWEFRRQVEEEARAVGVEALHERLALVDPLSAAKLHPHDLRRIIRALEVLRHTGQPISHLQVQFDEGRPSAACRVFVLDWPRAALHERINARVERMFAEGLVAETQTLLDRHGALGRTAAQAVGYCEVIDHLLGRQDLAATIELVKSRTRQFARRQETWFRGLSECRRVPQTADKSVAKTAAEIAASGST